jgi:hypothetical protein
MWWTKKYQKSHLSPEYNSHTIFELITEFYEDYFSENKMAMYELDLPFVSVGDPLVDKWEKEVRSGVIPDLLEGLSQGEAENLIDWSRKAYKKKVQRGMISASIEDGIGPEVEDLLGDDSTFKETF